MCHPLGLCVQEGFLEEVRLGWAVWVDMRSNRKALGQGGVEGGIRVSWELSAWEGPGCVRVTFSVIRLPRKRPG